MIQISKLPLITDAKTFFSTDKVLSADVFCIDEFPASIKLNTQAKGSSFKYNGKLYMPVIIKGSPENFFLRLKKGIPVEIAGVKTFIIFDGKLNDLLQKKKVYDFTKYYKVGEVVIANEFDFLIERYVMPYENKTNEVKDKLQMKESYF